MTPSAAEMDFARRIAALERQAQIRDAQEEHLTGGARLLAAVRASHMYGGGCLIEGWAGDSNECMGAGSAGVWTTTGMDASNYFATANGGPYATFNGANELFQFADSAWQEGAGRSRFTWRWVYLSALATDQAIIGKWHTVGDNRSWLLWYDSAAGAFSFSVSSGGDAATTVTVASTYAEAINTWYWVGGYFDPSNQMDVWVGAATERTLTHVTTAVGVPATAYNGNAGLTMGASTTPDIYLGGNIGVGHTRYNVPATDISLHANILFQMTRLYYR